ncbi:MAG: hypothetical protein N2111_01865 [Candidatus Sumerlaeaceae bacterium]|nr:hypothetical protein [Candidatus Sumerlaeaceae bacterium]
MTLDHLTRKPDWQRLRRALLCEGEPDCVPLIELGVHPIWKSEAIGRPCISVADEIEFARRAGYDYIKLQPGISLSPGWKRVVPHMGATKTAMDRNWAAEGEGAIRSMEDFEQFPWPDPDTVSYARFEEAERILPDEMAVIGQYGDIFTFVWEVMGFENFAMALFEQPELVEALFQCVGALIYHLFEHMAEFPRVQALWYSDDLAYTGGLMVSPKVYRQHLFPWVAKIGALCRARGIPFLYHSDGVLWEVLEDLIACGVTSLHPIEPKSMDVAEVKERACGRLAVLGSIEVDTLARGTPEQVEALVRDRLRRAAPGGGYALGSSNSVPDYAKYENYITMLEACQRLGDYPIRV